MTSYFYRSTGCRHWQSFLSLWCFCCWHKYRHC